MESKLIGSFPKTGVGVNRSRCNSRGLPCQGKFIQIDPHWFIPKLCTLFSSSQSSQSETEVQSHSRPKSVSKSVIGPLHAPRGGGAVALRWRDRLPLRRRRGHLIPGNGSLNTRDSQQSSQTKNVFIHLGRRRRRRRRRIE